MTDPASDHTTAARLRQWDNQHVWHPFTAMQAWQDESAPIIVAGEGFDLIDAEGNRYLDGISSLWCNVHGHRVPEIDEAVRNQLDRIAHSTLLGQGGEPSILLAKQLVDRTPAGLNRVFYSDSGSTAVEIAVKLAYQYHQQKPGGGERRDLFIGVSGAYHGDTVGSVSVGGIDQFHSIFRGLLFPTKQVPAPVALRVPQGFTRESYLDWCDSELERTLREHQHEIAAVIVEPLVQGAAGILVHPPGWLRRVRDLTSELGLLLIADEVAVGFGRTGTMFACEQEQVIPDLLCLAKGISGGYLPLAATLATEEIYEAFLGEPHEGQTFYHGHTYTGNALACAAALASLELFDNHSLLEHIARCAARLEQNLGVLAGHPHVAEVRQRGIMVGIELVADRETLEPFPGAARTGHQVTLAARRRGVIVRPLGDVVVLMPAPAIPLERIDQLCDAVLASIDEVTGVRDAAAQTG